MTTTFLRIPTALLAAFLAAGTALSVNITVTDPPYSANNTGGASASGAFQGAMNNIVSGGGGTLNVPPGHYRFDSQVQVNLFNKNVTIQGCGTGVSNIKGNNTSGVFFFSNNSSNNNLYVYDLSLMPAKAGAGTAFRYQNPSLAASNQANLYMRNVLICRDTYDAYQNSYYFNNGVCADMAKYPVFSNVNSCPGKRGNGTFYADTAIKINGTHSPVLENCIGRWAFWGFDIRNVSGNASLKDNVTSGVNMSFSVTCNSTAVTAVDILACGSGDEIRNLQIEGADNVKIHDFQAYCSSNTGEAQKNFVISNCTNVAAKGCIFHTPTVPVSELIGLYLGGTTGVGGSVLIENCIFHGNGRQAQDPQGTTTWPIPYAGGANVTYDPAHNIVNRYSTF